MLVLTCKIGERVFIGDNIIVQLVEIDRGRVRLGIQAPKDIPITRDGYKGKEAGTDKATNSDAQ